jgi:hypothetical protein
MGIGVDGVGVDEADFNEIDGSTGDCVEAK